MKLTIERAANGCVIRGDDRDDLSVVVADSDSAVAAEELLCEVNERIGHDGSPMDARRVRVIVLPGDKWRPPDGEACLHSWIERWEVRSGARWCCPCGTDFVPSLPGGAEEQAPGAGSGMESAR
jgi:hypothetical protein